MPAPDAIAPLTAEQIALKREFLGRLTGSPPRIIVYHANCHDGITALWVALREWPLAETYAGHHGEAPDLARLAGKDVMIVDFSWKRPDIMRVKEVAASLLILDHHKTAEADLAGLDFAVFDMARSGAGLTWDQFNPGEPRPPLVNYTEDRDLWRFALPDSKAVHAAVNCYPLTIEMRRTLMGRRIDSLAEEGRSVLRYHDKIVESAARHVRRETIAGVSVPSIACPIIEVVSDLGHRLAQGEPFAAIYVDQADGVRSYSLRSTDGGMDVGEVAKGYGGGGHRNAAGFRLAAGASL